MLSHCTISPTVPPLSSCHLLHCTVSLSTSLIWPSYHLSHHLTYPAICLCHLPHLATSLTCHLTVPSHCTISPAALSLCISSLTISVHLPHCAISLHCVPLI